MGTTHSNFVLADILSHSIAERFIMMTRKASRRPQPPMPFDYKIIQLVACCYICILYDCLRGETVLYPKRIRVCDWLEIKCLLHKLFGADIYKMHMRECGRKFPKWTHSISLYLVQHVCHSKGVLGNPKSL